MNDTRIRDDSMHDIEWFYDTCDKCRATLDGNCIEHGNGDSGYICGDCYSSLADWIGYQRECR